MFKVSQLVTIGTDILIGFSIGTVVLIVVSEYVIKPARYRWYANKERDFIKRFTAHLVDVSGEVVTEHRYPDNGRKEEKLLRTGDQGGGRVLYKKQPKGVLIRASVEDHPYSPVDDLWYRNPFKNDRFGVPKSPAQSTQPDSP